MTDRENELEKIESRLKSLESRLARLESAFVIPEKEKVNTSEEQVQTSELLLNSEGINEEEKGLESQIGLAWQYSFTFWHYLSYSVSDNSGASLTLSYS